MKPSSRNPFKLAETVRLAPNHGWKAQPGHKLLVLDRGTVQIEYPDSWIIDPDEDAMKLRDRPQPDDECVLGISHHRFPLAASGLPLTTLVQDAMAVGERPTLSRSPIVEEVRFDVQIAWGEVTFLDPGLQREACSRLALARRGGIQALLTFDFWPEDRERCDGFWRMFLATLQLGEYVSDPSRGPIYS